MGSMFSEVLLAGGALGSYEIARSLRFNSVDRPKLTNTGVASPTNDKKFTQSIWFKRGLITSATVMSLLGPLDDVRFNTDDSLGIIGNGGATIYRQTNQKLRDPSAMYHLVLSWDTANATAADRLRVYLNGTEITSWKTNNAVAQNYQPLQNKASTVRYISTYNGANWFFDGFVAEVIQVDGQNLLPTAFGEFDAITGAWVPKRYSGSFGANGFWLDFADNSNTTSGTLGKDRSGNNNDWTPSGFSVSAGIGNDSVEDTPTNNFPTLCNLLGGAGTTVFQDAGMTFTNAGSHELKGATIPIPSSGSWYWEVTMNSGTANMMGIVLANVAAGYVGQDARGWGWHNGVAQKFTNAVGTAWGSAAGAGIVVGVLYNASTGDLSFYRAGTLMGGGPAFTGLDTSQTYLPAISVNGGGLSINFGQRPFVHSVPSGAKALCSANMDAPAIQNPRTRVASFVQAGSGSAGSKTGLKFQPDWIKGKRETSGAQTTPFFTAVRGTGKYKPSTSAAAEVTDAQSVTAFNSDGYSFGTSTVLNASAVNYLMLCLKDDPANGIQIVTWTGDGAATKAINHSLGKKPSMLMAHGMGATLTYLWHKAFASDAHWCSMTTTTIASEVNTNSPFSAFNASTITVTNNATNNLNSNGVVYVAILFADGPLFASGVYTANASADGPAFYCGFRPALVVWSATNNQQWPSVNAGIVNNYNGNAAQDADSFMTGNGFGTYTGSADILAFGAKIRNSGVNYQSGTNRPWFALAEQAGKYARAV